LKIAYVTVRYGETIVGGAEQACRQLATHLAASGVEVSVHTTCATDAVTWADDVAPGTTVEAGVTVHRHRSVSGRDPGFDAASAPVLANPAAQSAATQREWLRLQGPICPDAVASAGDSGADLIVCLPYLYWPTVEATARFADRVVLHPAAHDEAPIRLPVFGTTFEAARGLAYFTDAERRLLERLYPSLSATPMLVAGLGIDIGPVSDGTALRERAGLGDRPYILCLGRVDNGKGALVLQRFFAAYKRRHPGPLALVFAGSVVHPPDPHPDVFVTGPLSEDLKRSALAGASVFVHPSGYESFSIVLLEAWAAGRPVLVNARCGPTTEHVRRSGAGLTYGGYAGFELALDRLLHDQALAAAMGAAGERYVEKNFAWPVVIQRYGRWLERLAYATVQ
jgi:glycosyltransferase involved in cell wall biosynthesis